MQDLKIGNYYLDGNNNRYEIEGIDYTKKYPIIARQLNTRMIFTFTLDGRFRERTKSKQDLILQPIENAMTKEEQRLENDIKKLQDELALLRENMPTISKCTIPLEKITKTEKCAWFDLMYNKALETVDNSIKIGVKTIDLRERSSDEAFTILNIRDEGLFWNLFNSIPNKL